MDRNRSPTEYRRYRCGGAASNLPWQVAVQLAVPLAVVELMNLPAPTNTRLASAAPSFRADC